MVTCSLKEDQRLYGGLAVAVSAAPEQRPDNSLNTLFLSG